MRLWTALLLSSAIALVVAATSCNGSTTDDGSSSGTPGDDDDNASSSGKTSSSGNSSSGQVNANVETKDETFVFNGNTRRYLLSKPTKFDAAKKYPLVLNLHGNPARPEDELAALPFDSVTKQEAVIAYPAAANGSDWDFSLPSEGNPDMPFIKALVDHLAETASVDPKRVLAYGYSGGAYFLSQFACRVENVASIVKMIAIVSGGAPETRNGEDETQCAPCVGGAVPMFIAHGVNDQSEVPFEGGDYARQCWSGTNGCGENDLSDSTAPCKKYNGCKQQTSWCPIPNHGHEPWPEGMQLAWDMFKALP